MAPMIKCLRCLVGEECVYSYDLKSATDKVASYDSGRRFGLSVRFNICKLCWFNVVKLVLYSPPSVDCQPGLRTAHSFLGNRPVVTFMAGQPLGYLSSWPLFTGSKHLSYEILRCN